MTRSEVKPAGKWLMLGEASKYLGVAEGTVRRWADAGELEHFKTPGGHRRFTKEALDEFMHEAGNKVPRSKRYGGPAHVLVVDDDASVREMLETVLRAEGLSTASAPSARDAMLSINRRVPDLLLLDVKMPGMDGWVMLQKIREKLDVDELPVILFSGEIPESELGQAGNRGAQAYLRKPFDPRKLVAQTKALLAGEAVAVV